VTRAEEVEIFTATPTVTMAAPPPDDLEEFIPF